MKFVLIVYLCSMINQSCPESMAINAEYNTHKECAMAGYEISSSMIDKIDDELVNRNKLAIKFECREIKPQIVPPPKPKIKV